ncbi:hypothetical protein GWK47_021405 [Chionoecetes opilio]|uniref:Uncharacterized protein n=1 Tax=Chionoecetes opilio TaxID=41210 RepID=A0A8J4XS17_CHIOP|nr:hypothetical protein GWK47_021405 [Chionoecetes opilio]
MVQGGPSGGGRRRKHHSGSTKPDRHSDREAGRGKKCDPRRESESTRQLTKEGNRRASTGRRCCRLLKIPAKKLSFHGCAATEGPWQESRAHPEEKQHHTLEATRGPGETGSGSRTEKGTRFHTGGTRSPTLRQDSRPAFIQGNVLLAREKAPAAGFLTNAVSNP